MRQAPPARRFHLPPPSPTSAGHYPQHLGRRRGGGSSSGSSAVCKTSTVLVGVVFLVVMAAVLLPSRYLSDTEHSTLRSRSSQILHKLEQLEQTTEHGLYQGLQQLEEVAEKGLHKLEEVAETWANGSSARMDAIDTGSADWPNHVYRLPSAPHATSPTAPPTPPKRRRVAYAITITKDGFFQDGAAVLAYSIFSVSRHTEFDISLIAFVHPNVSTSRPLLRKLGFHVIEAPKPVNVTAIDDKFTFLKEKLEKNGCCGSAELIKLNSYRLTQYEWVVHMDADTFLNNPIHELFDRDYSLIYTTDPNMATYKKDYCQPAQGGFLVLRPSTDDYKNIMNIVMTTGFFKGSGWNRSHIGWFWGGMTVQGVLPYYYNRITAPGRSQKIDRCVYNTMADTAPCEKQPLHEIKSAHFTVCQKPWNCYSAYVNPLCGALIKKWYALRKEAEAFYNITVNPKPCPRTGSKHYQRMDIDHATFPDTAALEVGFVPDESPDVLLPIGNSGFRPDAPYEEYRHN